MSLRISLPVAPSRTITFLVTAEMRHWINLSCAASTMIAEIMTTADMKASGSRVLTWKS